MENDSVRKVIEDTRRWLEQEKSWGGAVYATSDGEMGRGGDGAKRLPKNISLPPHLPTTPSATVAPSSSKALALNALFEKYNACLLCPLGASRLKFVFGVGDPNTPVLLIGEGPGYQEDHKGEPFVGRSGQLLDKMMESIGFSRQSIYIANIVKCHPMINPKDPESHGNDRPPTPDEVATCSPILQQQIAIIQPKVILTLGSPSTKAILGTQEGISKVRGRLYPLPSKYFKPLAEGAELFGGKDNLEFAGFTPEQLSEIAKIQVLPTYHPAALLRNPNLKKEAWEDLKLLRDTLATSAK